MVNYSHQIQKLKMLHFFVRGKHFSYSVYVLQQH